MNKKSAIKEIGQIKHKQAKYGKDYGKIKLNNLRGFFFPPANKSPERKQIFFSRSKKLQDSNIITYHPDGECARKPRTHHPNSSGCNDAKHPAS